MRVSARVAAGVVLVGPSHLAYEAPVRGAVWAGDVVAALGALDAERARGAAARSRATGIWWNCLFHSTRAREREKTRERERERERDDDRRTR